MKRSVLQLIDPESGIRSKPFLASPKDLYEAIKSQDNVTRDAMVLVVGEFDDESPEKSNMLFSSNPIFTVGMLLDSMEPNPEHMEKTADG